MVKVSSVSSVRVTGDGEGVVGHVGLHVLGRFADRWNVTSALSGVFPTQGGGRELGHDRGAVLTHGMLMLAGGGEACTDIEFLRAQPELFGTVASDSTFYRTMRSIDEPTSKKLEAAMTSIRERMWNKLGVADQAEVVLDIDASFHEVHSEHKEGTAAMYKGYGFHPLYVFADATGECVGHVLRPGNAGSNTLSDHLLVVDQAIEALPPEMREGHRKGDDRGLVKQKIRVRTDAAGDVSLANELTKRNIGFSMACSSSAQIRAAIEKIENDKNRWKPVLKGNGKPHDKSQVAELTDLVDDTHPDPDGKRLAWPKGTRLIVRREPLHPGAQRTLFDSGQFRYWGHRTTSDLSPVEADLEMRRHARVENHIARLKQSGANRFPFGKLVANRAWIQLVIHADAMVRWFQQLCLPGRYAHARPKTMRWWFWHTPARVTRHARRTTVHLPRSWPTTRQLLSALKHITDP